MNKNNYYGMYTKKANKRVAKALSKVTTKPRGVNDLKWFATNFTRVLNKNKELMDTTVRENIFQQVQQMPII